LPKLNTNIKNVGNCSLSLTKKVNYNNLEVLYQFLKLVKKKKKRKKKIHRATPMPPILVQMPPSQWLTFKMQAMPTLSIPSLLCAEIF